MSSSADCSVKIWNLSSLREASDSYTDKLNYTENDVKYFVTQLLHPSYVYACGFYPDTASENDSRLIIASVCYDQRVRLWLVSLDLDYHSSGNECLLELNILDKPVSGGKGASSKGYYDQDMLDDDALQMIVHPNNQTETNQNAFEYIHPNCMVFNANGRLFVGDSRGHISVWDVSVRSGSVYADNYFQIRQKELEGDEINQLIVHPEHENKLFIQSRDNCIRLLEYESMKGPRVRMRYFGAKCRDLMVRFCVSPDGQYLVAGSEDGTPHMWNVSTGEAFGPKVTRRYECRFLDLVSDISWNPRYNMFALTGFGHHFPVMVYVYERSEQQLNEILYSTSEAAMITLDTSTGLNNKSDVKSGFSTSRGGGLYTGGKENDHIGNVNVRLI